MTAVRIATFNLENFDETPDGQRPTLAERIALMKPQIARLRADIACFQEVNGQERPGQPRALLALAELLAGTSLQGASVISTEPAGGGVYDERNVVIVTRLPVTAHQQVHNDLIQVPLYTRITAVPPDSAPVPVGAERPILHVQVDLGAAGVLHVVNVHLKSKLPTDIPARRKTSSPGGPRMPGPRAASCHR